MSKLNIDQKTIFGLFADKKSDFLIPDYQRPYAWEDTECQTLWEDIFNFAFPENQYGEKDPNLFNTDEEYYLGSIVTFKNKKGQLEIIDGQQRLTTIILLLRAFYSKFGKLGDTKTRKLKESIEKCIWKVDEDENVIPDFLKISSEVATENNNDEFLNILKTGEIVDNATSQYAKNYRFFLNKIDIYKNDYSEWFSKFPTRILNNCILLPIEAESQDTALRIFSTLNDRGLPLSDADIFKAQFYKYYSKKGEKEDFIKRWKALEELTSKIFHPNTGTPMDELFTRYMYYERACQKIKLSTTEALRKFYEKNSYALLKNDKTLDNLESLADFWNDVSNQDKERFGENVLRRLYVLNYAPNGMWTYFTSVYFMKNKDSEGKLDDSKFCAFLTKITAFIFAYAITNPGVNALRSPVYAEMINIVEEKDIEFSEYKFDSKTVKSMFNNYYFSNARPITKSMLTWWAFNNEKQQLLSLESIFEIEHIFARKRQENEKSLSNLNQIESLGNKAILEKKINIRASDYRFEDKKKYYLGFTNDKGQKKDGTKIVELQDFATNKNDFTETDINARHDLIIDSFVDFLKQNDLLK